MKPKEADMPREEKKIIELMLLLADQCQVGKNR